MTEGNDFGTDDCGSLSMLFYNEENKPINKLNGMLVIQIGSLKYKMLLLGQFKINLPGWTIHTRCGRIVSGVFIGRVEVTRSVVKTASSATAKYDKIPKKK